MTVAMLAPAAATGATASRARARSRANPIPRGAAGLRQRHAVVAARVRARPARRVGARRGAVAVRAGSLPEAAQAISDIAAGVGLPCTVRARASPESSRASPLPPFPSSVERMTSRSLSIARSIPSRDSPRADAFDLPVVTHHLPFVWSRHRRQIQNCGDQIYRSTLDYELRGEVAPLFTPVGLGILAFVGTYLTITPGVAGGFLDYYILRPLLGQKRYSIDDFVLGAKLGEGGFGVVYKATGVSDGQSYVLKRCKDYGEAEIWTNSRLQRACPGAIASYCGAFYGPKESSGKNRPSEGSIWKRARDAAIGSNGADEEDDPLWIVWKFEGSETLFQLMNDKEFPYNVEPFLFKKTGGVAIEGEPRGVKRKAKIISTIFGQILENLSAAHATGIILRDVKPENMIFDPQAGRFKLIDLGAAADLRFGFNYQPKEFILDPRFSGPEEYIMSTQTPEAPATPVALALSPALWQLNVPDRFDSYSAGVTLLQMCLPTLRSDNNLIAFRRTLEENGESLTDWRNKLPKRVTSGNGPDAEGFAVLDAEDRAGWELCKSLMCKTREKRSSATGARLSRFVQGRNPVVRLLDAVFGSAPEEDDAEKGGLWAWLVFRVARSGTNREGGFTEAQLSNFQEEGEIEKTEDASKYLGYVASETLAKYGVERTVRTVAPESQAKRDKKRAAESAGEEEEDEAGAGPGFNPFRVINDNLQKLTNRD
jgi:serine/threonine protein kinase